MQLAETDVKKVMIAREKERLEKLDPHGDKNLSPRIGTRPFIAHAELHKKTYFKAVEKMLIAP
jgi:hypothetical protein